MRRMSQIMDKMIGECQHAFVSNIKVPDGALTANEVVDKLVNKKSEGVL